MKFRQKILVEINSTENYLLQRKNASALSESELDEEEERIQQKLSNFRSTVLDGKDNLERELEECKTGIRDDVEIALEQTENSLITMALNGADIRESLNNTVRSAVTISTKKRLLPVIEKYVKKVSKSMKELDIGDVNVAFSVNVDDLKTKVSTSVVATIVTGIALRSVLGLVLGIGMAIFNKLQGDKKREEAKRETREKLENEVFPGILRQVETGVDQVIKEQMMEINHSVESEIDRQQDILEKAMADVRNRKENEQREKENLEIDMNNDLMRLGELKDEL